MSASFSATVDGPLLLLEPECNLAWRFGCCAYFWFGHIFPVQVMNMSDEYVAEAKEEFRGFDTGRQCDKH